MSAIWYKDNKKPQEAGSYYTIIEDFCSKIERRENDENN